MTLSPQDRFRSALCQALGPEVPAPDETQRSVMFAYYAGVVEANRHFNLTRIVDPSEAAVKHFADALAVLGWVKSAGVCVLSVLDVGTGAGFPAVPLAIMRPDWLVTAIDSTGKKVRFVAGLSARLGLSNLSAERRRAGEWRPAQHFDLVLYKAVGTLGTCVKQARDLVKPGGYAIAHKTLEVSPRERREGLEAARRGRFDALEPFAYRLRWGEETLERILVIFRKL
ncbi:MAG: 16S rRNA (guanine(527)-N(7))-methyltransferase RsmG [Planctomycetota bacterium]